MIIIYNQNSFSNQNSFGIAQQHAQQQGFVGGGFQSGIASYAPISNAWSYRLQPIQSSSQAMNAGQQQQFGGQLGGGTQFTQSAYQESIPVSNAALMHQQTTGMLSPSISISETQDDLIIACNIPNVDIDNLNLTATDNSLSISAQAFVGQQSSGLHRTIPLPTMIRAEAVDADYNNGILQIRMPKREANARQQLQVNMNE